MILFGSTIKGGLPVLVEAWLDPPAPSQGLPADSVVTAIYWPNKRPYRGIVPSEDMERLREEACERIPRPIDISVRRLNPEAWV